LIYQDDIYPDQIRQEKTKKDMPSVEKVDQSAGDEARKKMV